MQSTGVRMKQQCYFTIDEKNLKVLHLESVRKMFYQIAGGGLIIFFAMLLLDVSSCLIKSDPLNTVLLLFDNFVFITVGILMPVGALIFARRFPPAPTVTFHSDTRTTTWKSGRSHLELPFDTINFATSRLLSKSGISTVMVSVFAIADKPFFDSETPSQNPDMRYRKDLCIYKAGTQDDADESIEIIKSFMAGTYDDSPSKFDDL